jgi:hypothetical protein
MKNLIINILKPLDRFLRHTNEREIYRLRDKWGGKTKNNYQTMLSLLKTNRFFILGLLIYICLYILLLPKFIIMRSDDWGYYESVILTIQNKTIITSDWLEPINAFFSLICWISYSLTNNFYFSTLGILLIFSVINFILFYLLLNEKLHQKNAAFGALLICTFPAYLNKSVDYIQTMPVITLFLLSLFFYKKKKWLAFFLVSFIAYSTRQSAIILLGLPIYYLLQSRRNNQTLITISSGFLLWGIGCFLIYKNIPVSYAQSHIANFNALFAHFSFLVFINKLIIGFFWFFINHSNNRPFDQTKLYSNNKKEY